MRWLFWLIAVFVAAPAVAQVQNFMNDGNLEPTQELGCIGTGDIAPEQTAADLAWAARACLSERDYDRTVQIFVAMQVFGVFDAQRVADISSHQAVAVLGQDIAAAIPPEEEAAFEAAVKQFGTAGQVATCRKLRQIGPPAYHPVYMIQHGTLAFLRPDDPPLVEGFQPEVSWDAVLTNFLNCPAPEG